MKTAFNHVTLIVLLAALTSVTPLSIDTYLPSMPAIAHSLGVGIEKIEATISIFLLFFAIGQMVGGILSDRMGRRKTALLGLGIFSLANFALYLTTSLNELYLFRAVQAFAGGLAIVNSSAIVRDLFHGTEAAKVFSTIASITMIAPMIAPAIGSVIISFFPWNTVFLFLGIYSSAVTFALFSKLPETGSRSTTNILDAYKRVLTHREAISYILALTFSFSGMFIFIEKSSFIYMEYFRADHRLFPFLFGANVLVMIGMTRLNIKLVKTFQPRSILKTGITVQFIAGLTLLGISFHPNIVAVFVVMTLYVGILGLIFGNGMSLALEFFKHDSGVANSVIGVTEFTIAGVIGYIASSFNTGELTPVFVMMSLTSFMAILALRLNVKQLS
ncbi:multidrug effflux MFS transporter [Sulfuricurvum sp.]|uniref:multidrug effflux MFS transporter n=1 Tax=Sulfuricurvum sp. TaxID=2025608 RepID=UPI0026027549|nr:multidrug effflux MFS transporter [Sulfuricurvum sp.]MDD2266684.1 multidrug effflux MFS transporter [Sulfuricurvum sp.]MDD2784132.1 multidrug effflux MFS transporter [Sulfuricurvum sp.]